VGGQVPKAHVLGVDDDSIEVGFEFTAAFLNDTKMTLRVKRGWWVMTTLSFVIATYAIILLFLAQARPPFLRGRTDMFGLAVPLHLAGGGVALALGAFQLNGSLRARRIQLHRILGRIYVVSVLIAGVSGLRLAIASQGGMIAHAGFAVLACAWLVTTTRGFLRIRAGDDIDHRAWMIRSYSLTFAAVMLRVYLPLALTIGVPFEIAYPAIAWLCWVPNIIVVERAFVRAVPAQVAM
jgi:uncharacterized membrane protein